MKLVDLISYFRRGGAFEDFCRANALDAESEVIEIYARKPVTLDSQLGFFPIEETKGQAEFVSGGVSYQTFFDFFYFLDVIQDLKGNDGAQDSEIARILLSYALKDA